MKYYNLFFLLLSFKLFAVEINKAEAQKNLLAFYQSSQEDYQKEALEADDFASPFFLLEDFSAKDSLAKKKIRLKPFENKLREKISLWLLSKENINKSLRVKINSYLKREKSDVFKVFISFIHYLLSEQRKDDVQELLTLIKDFPPYANNWDTILLDYQFKLLDQYKLWCQKKRELFNEKDLLSQISDYKLEETLLEKAKHLCDEKKAITLLELIENLSPQDTASQIKANLQIKLYNKLTSQQANTLSREALLLLNDVKKTLSSIYHDPEDYSFWLAYEVLKTKKEIKTFFFNESLSPSLQEKIQEISCTHEELIARIRNAKSYAAKDNKDLASLLIENGFILIRQKNPKDKSLSQHFWISPEGLDLQVRVKLQTGQVTIGLLKENPLNWQNQRPQSLKRRSQGLLIFSHQNEIAKSSGSLWPLIPSFKLSKTWKKELNSLQKNKLLDAAHKTIGYDGWSPSKVESTAGVFKSF